MTKTKSSSRRRISFSLLLLIGAFTLSSCSSIPDPFGELSDIMAKTNQGDAQSQSRASDQQSGERKGDDTDKAAGSSIEKGTGKFVNLGPAIKDVRATPDGKSFTLNFVNAEIADVARAILGDMLELNFVIDPGVRGLVTFQAQKPLPRTAVLAALDKVFAIHNVVIVQDDDLYKVLPRSKAKETSTPFQYGRVLSQADAGSRLQIVPINYISTRSMQNILGRLGLEKGVIYDDPDRNFLILSGTQNEVQNLLDTIDIFDINSMKGMSFGFFKVTYVDAASLAQDLAAVFDRTDASLAELIELIPIPRSNTILVISPQPEYIVEVEAWMKKLDQRKEGPDRRMHYYVLQNAKAEDVAETLNSILGFQSAAPNLQESTSVSPENALAPPRPFANTNSSLFESNKPRVVADAKNNAVIIYANASEYDTLFETLQQIDVAPDQVLIEASIAEVTLTDELKYGIQWFFENAESTATLSEAASGAVTSLFPGFSYTYVVSNARAALNALSAVTDVNVLSSPKIMTLNNQTARLQVGDEVPIATQSAVSITDPDAPIVNAVEFRDTGVILEVTPRINKSGLVIMEINQEVSDVAETTTSGIDSPTIQQRKVASTVAVNNGETVALGGLIRNNKTVTKGGVPILSKVPVIGIPFGSTDRTERRTELVIFITPRIVRDASEARDITDYLRAKLIHVDLKDHPDIEAPNDAPPETLEAPEDYEPR